MRLGLDQLPVTHQHQVAVQRLHQPALRIEHERFVATLPDQITRDLHLRQTRQMLDRKRRRCGQLDPAGAQPQTRLS